MSATNRGSQRIPQDAYATPSEAIDVLLPHVHIHHLSTFLEPCRGTGAIYDRIRCHRRLHCEIAEGTNYLTWKPKDRVDLIITNPPFSLAQEFLEKSLEEAATVIYLLRLNFWGSRKRKPFWKSHRPTHQLTLSERPCFVWACKGVKGEKKGCGALYHRGYAEPCEVCGGKVSAATDACEYAWFCWDRGGMVLLAPGMDVL